MKFRSKRLPLAMSLLGLSILTTSCATSSPTTPQIETVVKADCVNWKIVTYSAKSDSPETIRQIIEQNARRQSVCGQ